MILLWSVGSVLAGPPETPDWLEGLELSGFAQIDYQNRQISLDELSDGTREPLNEDRFAVRRARVRVGHAWRYFALRSVTELFSGGTTVRPVSLEAVVHLPSDEDEPPPLQLRAGLFPVAFGFESYEQTDDYRFFAERALFTYSMIPGRFDLGVGLQGHFWAIDWIVAVQNGEPLESGAFAFRDPNAAKDISGRLRISGDLFDGVRAAAGGSVLSGTGFSPGTPPTKDSFEWRDLNEDGRVILAELIPVPGSAGRPSENFDRFAVGGDVQMWADLPVLGELFVFGEVAVGVNIDRAVAPADPVLLGRDQRSVGFLVGATQDFGRHVTAGVRFEQYDPNLDALEQFGGDVVVTRRRFRTVTTGVALQHALSDVTRLRLLGELELQQNSLGRDARGRPAQLANDAVRVRLEVRF